MMVIFFFDQFCERFSFDIFHDKKVNLGPRFDLFINVESADDVWVIECCDCFCFAIKATEVRRVSHLVRRQDFDGAKMVHQDVSSEIDRTHLAGPEQTHQPISPQEEALMSALQQLVGLPTGDEFATNEFGCDCS